MAMNRQNNELSKCEIDPAAVFASAISIWNECGKRAESDPSLNFSNTYHGVDQLMREVMRAGEMFEKWACLHVAFEEFPEVWPYFLEDCFGAACLQVMEPDGLAGFDEKSCLLIAYQLRLPVRLNDSLCLPVDIRMVNPVPDSAFKEFRIQTVRDDLVDGDIVPFTPDDEPFDENYGNPYFGFYGIGENGLLEHIADRKTYAGARDLVRKIAPGVQLPEEPVCLGKKD
ncbi:MAG: hypothetical protein QM680_01510 [Luteolibacter sp.]